VRRPRSQKVVDLARQYGRVYAYAEKTEDCPEGLHTDPKRMMKFFGSTAAFTNMFDVKGQNDEAMELFEDSLEATPQATAYSYLARHM